MNIAIIPARGGSKRIPRKNIKLFCGKPMIVWSIETALNSGCFDRVIVSTDDAEIAEVAKKAGAEVPFFRPTELADDFASTEDVIIHAVQTLDKSGKPPELICCIYPTAPLLQPESLQHGLTLLQQKHLHYALSVASYAYPIQRALRLDQDSRLEMFQPEHRDARSQDLTPAYHDAGQFYWGTRRAWLERQVIFGSNSAAVVLPRYRVTDIDTEEDWICAELMFRMLADLERH